MPDSTAFPLVFFALRIWFDSNAHQVKLHHFGFRRNEKFRYHYDFGDDWQHEIRVEAILPVEDKKVYPMCIAGKRAAPPEDCGGVEGYVEQQQAAPLETLNCLGNWYRTKWS